MYSNLGSWTGRAKRLVATGLVAGVLAACHGNVLDVKDPDNVQPSQLTGPSAVANLNAGVIGDFREMYDNYVRYSGLLTDEFMLAGTFPTRREVDFRAINADNATLTDELYTPLQVTRTSADKIIPLLTQAKSDPAYSSVLGDVDKGIVYGQLYGGYDRIFFAEAYCQSIFSNPTVESAPVLPMDRAKEAQDELAKAASAAATAGLTAEEQAATVGEARALMFQGQYQQAASLVSSIPSDFTYLVNYSSNHTAEENEVYQLTWNYIQALRWTVGDGTTDARLDEKWPYLTEWLNQGLLIPPDQNNLTAFGSSSWPVYAQTVYGGVDPDPSASPGGRVRSGQGSNASILLASGWEARMIEAEAALRNGDYSGANTIVNGLLSETTQSDNPMRQINSNVPFGAFSPVNFSADSTFEANIKQLARARAAGMWISGTRQGFFRRLALNDNIDLYPPKIDATGSIVGEDIAFPVVKQEYDNNSNISQPCPGMSAAAHSPTNPWR